MNQPARRVDISWFLLFVIILILLSFWLLAHYMEQVRLDPFFQRWFDITISDVLPSPFLFFMELFHWRVLRHLIPVATGGYLAYRAVVGLVKTLYELPDDDNATRFLARLRAASPAGIPPVTLKSSTLAADRAKSVLLRVGGPGMVKVSAGDVVVTEFNGRFQQILPAGTHKLGRFETIHSVLDLRLQDRSVKDITLLTRDGVELMADLTINFRIQRGSDPTPETPFPFAPEAVRRAAYHMRVQSDIVDTWQTHPPKMAQQTLYAVVAELNLDDILEPDTENEEPYFTINNRLQTRLRPELANLGLELVAAHVDQVSLPQLVTEQVLDFWQTRWEIQRQLAAIEGEAEALQEIDLARTEAEITMIQAIIEGVRLARQQGSPSTMRDVVAMRLLEALERMARGSDADSSLTQQVLPRLTQMRQQVAPPYANPRLNEGNS